jgi:hypothetical protein
MKVIVPEDVHKQMRESVNIGRVHLFAKTQ